MPLTVLRCIWERQVSIKGGKPEVRNNKNVMIVSDLPDGFITYK